MRGIGGNVLAELQVKSGKDVNQIGELVPGWVTVQRLKGWLDFSSGEARHSTFNAKIEESTHVFVADYVPLNSEVKAESSRMIVNGDVYEITLIDNPMGLKSGSQWEIYLKYTGGQ